jgi:hypothetical protein
LLAAPALAADVELPWQARLVDAAGGAIHGAHDLTLTLSDADAAPRWSRRYEDVALADGYVALVLAGPDDSARPLDSALFLDPLYLSVAVDDGPALGPATAVGTVPRAAAVRGSVQLGPEATACNGDRAGLLRFTGGAIEACDGAAWTPILSGDTLDLASLTADTLTVDDGAEAVTLTAAGIHGADGLALSGPARVSMLRSDGAIYSRGSLVQRDLLHFMDTAQSSTPIHIKTNIPVQSNIMYKLVVDGYNYGNGTSILSEAVGYPYGGVSCLTSQSTVDHAGGVAISQYCSSDGYVVIKLTAGSFYYVGFTVSAYLTNPTGTGFVVSATAVRSTSNL